MRFTIRLKGGAGSGHFGHKGIPGHKGGSLPRDGSASAISSKRSNTDTKSVVPKTEVLDFSRSAAKRLNSEWNKTYDTDYGGPFWDARGEANAKYYAVRDDSGKLIAGATTKQRGVGTEILSIESRQAGEGIKLLNNLKSKNLFLFVMSSSKNSDKWYEKFGFRKDTNHPNQYNYVWNSAWEKFR